jgi:hypothetical protein
MNYSTLGIAVLSLATMVAFGQVPSDAKKFPLFQIDRSCVCVKVKKETKTVTSTEIQVGRPDQKAVYQVFWSRTLPKRELFRIEVGRSFDGQLVRTWFYGIAEEGDFNGDGVPDYSWYGGDDTGLEMYLFLSSDGVYKRVDLINTIEFAWHRRFNRPPPDLGEVFGDYTIGEMAIERSTTGLVLNATVRHNNIDMATETTKPAARFSIGEANFK